MMMGRSFEMSAGRRGEPRQVPAAQPSLRGPEGRGPAQEIRQVRREGAGPGRRGAIRELELLPLRLW